MNSKRCSYCGENTEEIKGDLRPVFYPEKLILSIILQKNIIDKIVWAKDSNYYLVNGKKVVVDYVSIVRNKEKLNKLYKEFIKKFDRNKIDIYTDAIIKFVRANKEHFQKITYEAENYINDIINQYTDRNFIPVVSFSGGKDSTVVSNLVRDAIGEQRILHYFANTTLEFELTEEYIEEFKKENPFVPFIIEKPNQNFFDLCNEFGPPSRLERWCCTIFKTGTLGKLFNILPQNKKPISFSGIRKAESVERSKYKRTQDNSKINRQIVAMPIIDWLDIEVWLYILTKKLNFNKAYYYGFTRVGCWCCPNNSNWSTLLTSLYMREKYIMWRNILIDYAKKAGKLDYEVYVDHGYWKARRGLKGLEKIKPVIKSQECTLYENSKLYVIEKVINENFIELLKPFGILKILWKDETNIMVEVTDKSTKKNLFNAEIYLGKNYFKIIPKSEKNLHLFYQRVECQINKYLFCIGCSACDNICPTKAINTFEGRYEINSYLCINCKNCIAKFYGGCLRAQIHKSKI